MAERRTVALSVEYEMSAAAAFGNEPLNALALDICANGIGVLTDHPLEKGDVVILNFPVRSLGVQLPVFVEVAWAAAAQDRFRAGLKFLR